MALVTDNLYVSGSTSSLSVTGSLDVSSMASFATASFSDSVTFNNDVHISGSVSSMKVTGTIKSEGGFENNDYDMTFKISDGSSVVEAMKIARGGVPESPIEVVVNDGSQTYVDFRVESDTEDEALFIDASANELYVNKGETAFVTRLANVNDVAITIDSTGVVFNEDGHITNDFRVESDTNSHMMFVDSGKNKIGINESSPMNIVQISHTGADGDDGLLIVRDDATTIANNLLGGIGFDSSDGNVPSSILEASAYIAGYANAAHSTLEKSGYLVFGTTTQEDPDDTTSHEWMRITHNGYVGINTTDNSITPNAPLHVAENRAAGYVARFENDGNGATRYGIYIKCGQDTSGTGTLIQFADGNGTSIGDIDFSSTTVAYNAFTGAHPVYIEDANVVPQDEYPYGTIIKTSSTSTVEGNKSVDYVCSQTTSAKDPSVLGVYNVSMKDKADNKDRHSIFAIGDGHILVCAEGGDISIGDFICSSSTPGHGMKQDDDLMHNYTVAKSSDLVNWSQEPGATKLIACTYHAG